MAEFVDNSLQSALDYQDDLLRLEGAEWHLRVEIEVDCSEEGRILIRDNAAGIHAADYQRAFRPAEIPPDRSGLSEFGIGMKSAACWFGKTWTVRTSALGEPVERTVNFDIDRIVNDSLEELNVESRPVDPKWHYTEIILTGLHNPPQTRTLSKIKSHLASIYRVFLREGLLKLQFEGEDLSYTTPKTLRAPFYRTPSGDPVEWRKEIYFDLGQGLSAKGFAALREMASVSGAGFALFRRNRLIQGSADEGYRPEKIFGKSNSYRYQRLFGELHLEGFDISHTKDGFRWDEQEDAFLDLLKEHLDSHPVPLLDQAEGHRSRPRVGDFKAGAEIASERTAGVITSQIPPLMEELSQSVDNREPDESLPPALLVAHRTINVSFLDQKWEISVELTDDPGVGDWLTVSDRIEINNQSNLRKLGLRLSLVHPFMQRFGGTDVEQIEPLLRVAAAIALAETAARENGVRMAGTIRRNINELLKGGLSQP